jgi:hypothetical protein
MKSLCGTQACWPSSDNEDIDVTAIQIIRLYCVGRDIVITYMSAMIEGSVNLSTETSQESLLKILYSPTTTSKARTYVQDIVSIKIFEVWQMVESSTLILNQISRLWNFGVVLL